MKKRALSEAEWKEVFRVRCKNKRGEQLNEQEQMLVERAWSSDRARYRNLDADVFDATVPFGSTVRYPRRA